MKRALWVLSENKWQLLTWTVKTNKTLLVSGLRNMLVLHLWTSWDSSCGYRLLPLELMYQQVPSVIKDTHFMLYLSYYRVIFGTRRVSSVGTAVTQIKKQLQVHADLIFTATIIRSFSQVSLLTWSSVGTVHIDMHFKMDVSTTFYSSLLKGFYILTNLWSNFRNQCKATNKNNFCVARLWKIQFNHMFSATKSPSSQNVLSCLLSHSFTV